MPKNNCGHLQIFFFLSSFNKIHDREMKTCNKDFSKNCKKSISFGLNYLAMEEKKSINWNEDFP